ncbi:MAG: UDP-N-acetylmuramate dehydrogenase [Elusimicrobia bacterium]|nr:UDP-N-acetylmuramate dehydrogenase [Elusimicrobiota bacterium]
MKELKELGISVKENEPMSKHTTLAIGGPAEWYLEIFSLEQLKKFLSITHTKKKAIFFLGAGSNILVSDQGLDGFIVRLLGEFEMVSFSGSCARSGAGVFLPTLVKKCAEQGLGGAEALVGVPGTVGGALMMNAGTRDLEIGTLVKSVEIVSLQGIEKKLDSKQINFQYRCSSLAGSIICFATLQLQEKNKDDIIRIVQEFLSYRLKTQPIGTLNVGSIFKNPKGHFAAQLIENAGLKGFKIGQAQVSPKHANFIVNLGGAKAKEMKDLIFEIQRAIEKKFGIHLEPEIKFVGQ